MRPRPIEELHRARNPPRESIRRAAVTKDTFGKPRELPGEWGQADVSSM